MGEILSSFVVCHTDNSVRICVASAIVKPARQPSLRPTFLIFVVLPLAAARIG
jgi:hypothetical protein